MLGEVDRLYRFNDRSGVVRLVYGASCTRQSTWGELFASGFETFDKNPRGTGSSTCWR